MLAESGRLMSSYVKFRGFKAGAVIGDNYPYPVGNSRDLYGHGLCLSVFCDVDNQFTYCLEEQNSHVVFDRFWFGVILEVGIEAVLLSCLPDEPVECGFESKLVQYGWAQFKRKRSRTFNCLSDQEADFLERVSDFLLGNGAAQRIEPHLRCGQCLTNVVMKAKCDSASDNVVDFELEIDVGTCR